MLSLKILALPTLSGKGPCFMCQEVLGNALGIRNRGLIWTLLGESLEGKIPSSVLFYFCADACHLVANPCCVQQEGACAGAPGGIFLAWCLHLMPAVGTWFEQVAKPR